MEAQSPTSLPSPSIVNTLFESILNSPFNLALCMVCAYFIYRLWRGSHNRSEDRNEIKVPPPLEPHDMDLEELKKYDGRGPDGRVCIAINGKVFDVSTTHFYRPGGPYSSFAGRDATRGLAKFNVTAVSEEWDDHSDLSSGDWTSVKEWEMQFSERYTLVGRLVKDLDKEETDPSLAEGNNDDNSSTNPQKAKDD